MKNLNSKKAIIPAILITLALTTASFAERYNNYRHYRNTPIVVTNIYRQPASYYVSYSDPYYNTFRNPYYDNNRDPYYSTCNSQFSYFYDDSCECKKEKKWVRVAKTCSSIIADAIRDSNRPTTTIIYSQPRLRPRSTIIFTPKDNQRHSIVFQNNKPGRRHYNNSNNRRNSRREYRRR